MPTLEWIGKSKVINHHQEVPFRVLERKYSFDENGEHSEDNGSDNMIIRGDNLEALKALLPRYEGRVKCIYIDPPYNTGNEGWVYNDNVNDPKIKKWLGEVVGKEGEDLTRHDKWLCMMYPRLKLLQKLLADDGVIFISIDDREQVLLRMICNEIFGEKRWKSLWNAGRFWAPVFGARLLDLTTPGDFFTGAWNSGGKLGGKCLKPGWENRDKAGNHGIFRLWKSGDVENFPVKARRRYGRNDGFTDETAAAPGPASPAADSGQRGL